MSNVIAKISGWLQFAFMAANQVALQGSIHGWAGWLTTIASLAAAIGIHAASESTPAVK